jgi:hypothetical protein
MKILAIEKELQNVNESDYKPFLADEAKSVWEKYKSGIIREIYFTEKDNRAVLVLECENQAEAEKILSELPLVKNNLITFEFNALKNYDGFERLFK